MSNRLLEGDVGSLSEFARLVPSAVLVIDGQGELLWADDDARSLFGLERGTTTPAMFDESGEHVPPDERPYMRVFEVDEPVRGLSCRAALASGRRPITVDAVPLTADGDVSRAALTVAVDDGSSNAATPPPDESASRLGEVLERIDDAFFALDRDWRFTYVNGQAETLIERSESELLGERVWDAFPGAVGTTFQEQYEHAMSEQEPVAFDEYYPPLDAWFEVQAYPSETGLSVYFKDIADRKERERELEEYETILETIDDGVYVIDESGRFTMVNDAYAELTGYSRAELLGMHRSQIVDDDVVDRANEIHRRLQETDARTERLEAEITTADGDAIVAEATFSLLEQDGETRRVGVIRDVTDRKERERELRAQREQLDVLNDINSLVQRISETVVEQSDPAAVQSAIRSHVRASEFYRTAWIGTVNADRDAIVRAADTGGTDLPVDLPLDVHGCDSPSVEAARTGEIQVARISDDDNPRWATAEGIAAVAAVPLTFDGALYGVLTVYTSRSDAFEAAERATLRRLGTIVAHAILSIHRETRLDRSERLYRRLAENIPNGSATMFDTDCRYQIAAGELLDWLDLDPRDLRGKRPTEIDALPESATERIERSVRDALDGDHVSYELEYDGRVLDAQTIPIYDDEGSVVSALTLSQDITERVEHQRELEHERERLELLIRLIRHNFLNSLNVVDARLEFLDGRVDYEVSEHLNTARDRTAEMIDLVETIRSLTDTTMDGDEHDLGPVLLDEVLADEVASVDTTYADAEVVLGRVPAVDVRADELLGEALGNVLHNAVQHNDKPTPHVTVDATATEETVTVSIADNGPGIDDDLKARIFEKGAHGFHNPGTGFGLHIVREIIDSYDGEVAVRDNDPEGTVFQFVLHRTD